ncbi:hypothetical protein EHR01_10680 [Leptospira mtsangambouensis]|uniref:TFIIB-type zinc ribbon-containing protein n=1 Tax=Leptospira mtsangambouensis TaxID=2484912 RepID=A0ABY2NYV3_9LEPT|nr:hypothetical protein [Leptospira mtsangambouensis]TGM74383.1 hypothetical protein EHR01_10680 [Leptospira mtsangambouensis]
MKKEYSRKIELICPLCGSKLFEYDEQKENPDITCISCKKIFKKDELTEANQENFSININELHKEATKDIAKDLKEILKKTLGKNKNFKIK